MFHHYGQTMSWHTVSLPFSSPSPPPFWPSPRLLHCRSVGRPATSPRDRIIDNVIARLMILWLFLVSLFFSFFVLFLNFIYSKMLLVQENWNPRKTERGKRARQSLHVSIWLLVVKRVKASSSIDNYNRRPIDGQKCVFDVTFVTRQRQWHAVLVNRVSQVSRGDTLCVTVCQLVCVCLCPCAHRTNTNVMIIWQLWALVTII